MTAHHNRTGWRKASTAMRPILQAQINAGLCSCVDCGRPVEPGQPFDVGHIVGVSQGTAMGWTEQELNARSNLGASHRGCNRSAGGKQGKAIQVANRKRKGGFPNW